MENRVTSQSQLTQAIAYMQKQASDLATVQNQISSGVRLQKPSDNPTDFVTAMRSKALDQRYATYLSTIDSATNTLNASVSALTDANSILSQAKQLASQGVSADTDPNAMEALATQVDALVDRLTSTANTQVDGRYIFGGTATQQPPFAVTATTTNGRPATITYKGVDQRAQTLIGPGITTDTLYSGAQIFQQPGADSFQALIQLRDDLRNTSLDSTGRAQVLNNDMTALDSASKNVLNSLGEQSASLQNMSSLQSHLQDLQLDAQTQTSNLEGTDYAAAMVRMSQIENVFQATLAVSAKMFNQNNLLNFIQ